MLDAARRRTVALENVDIRRGELEALPLDAASLDVALLTLVLHYAADPLQVLLEVQRVLRARGRLLLIDMTPHDRAEYQQQMGHVWLGFSEKQMGKYLAAAGFEHVRVRALPPDTAARGPGLFAATAMKK